MKLDEALQIADNCYAYPDPVNLEALLKLAAEVRRLQVSHRRYETLRRLNVPAFKALVEANIKIGKPFDQLVDELAPFTESKEVT